MQFRDIVRLIDCVVIKAFFNSISVISQWPVDLSMLSWSSFNQYSAQYSSQATGYFPTLTSSKQWTAVRDEWMMLQWPSILGKNIDWAGDQTSHLLFSRPVHYWLSYEALQTNNKPVTSWSTFFSALLKIVLFNLELWPNDLITEAYHLDVKVKTFIRPKEQRSNQYYLNSLLQDKVLTIPNWKYLSKIK